MPYKLRNDRRHKFDKVRYKITNWSEYNEALKKRGSVTLWLSDEIIKAWYVDQNKPKERGGQFKYSDIAIEAFLTIKVVYHLPYRGAQGFLSSIMNLMNVAIDVPDYTRVCRRAKTLEVSGLKNIETNEDIHVLIDSTGLKIFGQGQWHEEKHGLKKRREWRKLHLAIDRDTQAIVAQELTSYHESDDSKVEPLLEAVEKEIASVSADTAYDTNKVYEVILENCRDDVVVSIPPRNNASLSTDYQTSPNKRDHKILFVEKYGKYRWQDYSDYNYRSLAETAMFRYKKIIGDIMYSKDLLAQKVETKVGCNVLNTMVRLGMPVSVKIKSVA
jgi:hypothetical protein